MRVLRVSKGSKEGLQGFLAPSDFLKLLKCCHCLQKLAAGLHSKQEADGTAYGPAIPYLKQLKYFTAVTSGQLSFYRLQRSG